ncbi:MAG: hypothetical protein U1E58_02965 [Tabrizicola sp.]
MRAKIPVLIKPIIEYAPLDYAQRANSDKHYIFEDYEEADHSYWWGVVSQLKRAYGLYLFYDSLTRPLYVGIARDQSLWVRANQSYNVRRDRNGKIMEVRHPSSSVTYKQDQVRPVRRTGFALFQVAEYFSAYEVPEADKAERDRNIAGLEAFAVRAFGGVLLNTKMEGNGGFGLSDVGEVES